MNFDDNQWYHVYVGGDKDNSFVGTALVFGDPLLEDTTKHNTTTGAVFKSTNQIENDEGTQKWQIVPVDSDYYVFRTWAGGVHGYLSTNFAENRSNLTSRTLGRMVRDNVSDASVYWKITSWKDGTFQLTNKRNGTDWLMEIGGEHDEDDGTEAHMSSNFTKIPRRQFSFEAIGEVNGTDIGKINNGDWARASISVSICAVIHAIVMLIVFSCQQQQPKAQLLPRRQRPRILRILPVVHHRQPAQHRAVLAQGLKRASVPGSVSQH